MHVGVFPLPRRVSRSVFVCCRCVVALFFFQAEDGIRDAQESRGLGDVYKRQELTAHRTLALREAIGRSPDVALTLLLLKLVTDTLSLIHI